jgi:hypothetical protein
MFSADLGSCFGCGLIHTRVREVRSSGRNNILIKHLHTAVSICFWNYFDLTVYTCRIINASQIDDVD